MAEEKKNIKYMEKQYFTRERIPKKLGTCHILNSYITIGFSSPFDCQYWFNQLIEKTKDQYHLNIIEHPFLPNNINEEQYLCVSEKCKIKAKKGEISFNCNNSYPGWGELLNFIIDILGNLHNICESKNIYHYITLNYISTFPKIDIFDKLDGKVELFRIPPFADTILDFKCAIQYGDQKADSAKAQTKIRNNMLIDGKSMSAIDISIFKKITNNSIPHLIEMLNFLHANEKLIFFNLISQEFIEEQDPEY